MAKPELTGNRVQGRPEQADRVLLPVEAAELLRVSIHQLYHLTSKKKIPFTKVGGALRFDRARLEEFLAGAGTSDDRLGKRPRTGSRNGAGRGTNGSGAAAAQREGSRFKFNTPARTSKGKK